MKINSHIKHQDLKRKALLFIFIVLGFVVPSAGQALTNSINQLLPGIIEPQRFSVLLEALLVLTFIAFIPAFLVMTTSFLRMVVVLSFLRHALGTQQTPPNTILIGLALILTFFIMGPTVEKINEVAIQPYQKKTMAWSEAFKKGAEPIRDFMFKQTRKKDLNLALKLAKIGPLKEKGDVPFSVLATAFAISELKTAFEIGFIIFIPFILIDMVVASVLMSLGMMMVPPTVISLPLKILLFVMMDGWNLLVRGLVDSVR